MANERNAVVTYQGNGSQKVYTFPFDYLQKAFIKVKLINVDEVTELTYGTDYTVSGNEVTLVSATTSVIQIYRETTTERLVAWEDASVLRASDMTLQEVQLLHIAQETMDKVQDGGLALDPTDGVWDARLKKIKNVTNPSEPLDVVNKQYFESTQAGYLQASQAKVDEATAQAVIATTKAAEASASASSALTSKNNAATSATASANSASQAATSATNAANSASTATTKAAEASASATSAADSASTATTKAGEAATSATNAANYATSANTAKNTCEAIAGALQLPTPSLPDDVGKAMSVKTGGGWELKNFAPNGYGLGTLGSPLISVDLNTVYACGFYTAYSNCSNRPATSQAGHLLVESFTSAYVKQTFSEISAGFVHVRFNVNNTWSAWKRLTASDEVLLLSGGTMTGSITIPNGYNVGSKTTGGAGVPLLYIDSYNKVYLGNTSVPTTIRSSNQPEWYNGSVTKTLATTDQLTSVPSGAVSHFAMSSPPSGWLKANGAAVSRTTYSGLFSAIGTTFGVGDGSTTFNLPDLRGVFMRGWDDGRGYDSGRVFGSYQADDNKAHSHSGGTAVGPTTVHSADDHTAVGTLTGSSGGAEARPKNVALLACIKY